MNLKNLAQRWETSRSDLGLNRAWKAQNANRKVCSEIPQFILMKRLTLSARKRSNHKKLSLRNDNPSIVVKKNKLKKARNNLTQKEPYIRFNFS